jgi:D-alanine-D-alanine ligase
MSLKLTGRNTYRIAVLMGGESAEREISLQSGRAVAEALASRGHHVTCVDAIASRLAQIDWPTFDIAFLALHGRFGEDGQIQALFDSWGVPYTGCGAAASRLAFSKSAAKERLLACSVNTPPYALIHRSDSLEKLIKLSQQIGYPLVVKPDASGSSLGVSIVHAPEELSGGREACFAEGEFALIEQMVPGTEWTLGVIDGEPLPLIQIRTPRVFYDFQAKYSDDGTCYDLDFAASSELIRSIEAVGLAAVAAIGTEGIARVDLRVDFAERPWVLEVNTIPGFTSHSLVPKAAGRVGMSLGELCERAIESGLNSHQSRRQTASSLISPGEFETMRSAG